MYISSTNIYIRVAVLVCRYLTDMDFFGFQLNTLWTQIEVVELTNDGSGLGFGISGNKSTGVVVTAIVPGSIADKVKIYQIFSFCDIDFPLNLFR